MTVQGVADREDDDYYQVQCKKGQRLSVEVEAMRLGRVMFDPYIAILDKNRFEQELIYYLEKMDINEEKVRLSEHCNHFTESLSNNPKGKSLNFVAQEMGREINTLGSKANHTGIQKEVIAMKEELEKIKEQVLNLL